MCPEFEALYQPNKKSRNRPAGKQTENEERRRRKEEEEERAAGAEWGEGSGGMFTSVLLGHCFRDGVGGVRFFFLRGMGGWTLGGVREGGKN